MIDRRRKAPIDVGLVTYPTLTRKTKSRRRHFMPAVSLLNDRRFGDALRISNDLFGGVSTEMAHGVAEVVRDYTREYTSLGYIIGVRTRLFSPSSPGESFLVPPAIV